MHPIVLTKIASAAVMMLALTGCVGIQLSPQERSFGQAMQDLQIQTELNARLIGEDPVLFANTNSTVIEGRVHLSGTVSAADARRKITQIAWSVAHVREVINDVDVTSSFEAENIATDRWMTAQLRSRMVADETIKDSNFSIDTENGTIFVHGIAQDDRELKRVLAHARAIPGTRKVVNYAVLKNDPRRASIERAPSPANP